MIRLTIGQSVTLWPSLTAGRAPAPFTWTSWSPCVTMQEPEGGGCVVTGRQPGQTTIAAHAMIGGIAYSASVDVLVGDGPGFVLAPVDPAVVPNSFAPLGSLEWCAVYARTLPPKFRGMEVSVVS